MLEFFIEHLSPEQEPSQMTPSRIFGFITGGILFSDVCYYILSKYNNVSFSIELQAILDNAWGSLSDMEKDEWDELAEEVEKVYQDPHRFPLLPGEQDAWFRLTLWRLSGYLYSAEPLGDCILVSQHSYDIEYI